LVLWLLTASTAQAWWNEEWTFRKKIVLDTSAAEVTESVTDFPVLVRLHSGNFGYFMDVQENGADLRFVASDDKTPLKYHIEKFDLVNQMAYLWVKLPRLSADTDKNFMWMYYGNPDAKDAADPSATYGTDAVAVYHFNAADGIPKDQSAYENHADKTTADTNNASLIAAGLKFAGNQHFTVKASPSLRANPEDGFSFSTWLRISETQKLTYVFEQRGETQSLALLADEDALFARIQRTGENTVRTIDTPKTRYLSLNQWHHVALTLSQGTVRLYVDGELSVTHEVTTPQISGDLTVGASGTLKQHFIGELDELRIAKTARPAAWFKASVANEGMENTLLSFGEDQQNQKSAGKLSYLITVVESIDQIGWTVIIILAIMGTVSMMVIFSKGLVLSRTQKDNNAFVRDFRRLKHNNLTSLDDEDDSDDGAVEGSAVMAALFGKHDHYQSSTLYHLYHAGISEMHSYADMGANDPGIIELSPNAISSIRAAMDFAMVRELQKLQKQLVVVTIAIAGGPFLGLLGTVIGVLVTFAVIAATGDVNVNTIAPGIAAALTTTVAGLFVAIPALFGYNYLALRLKNITADMHAFIEQFVTKIARDPHLALRPEQETAKASVRSLQHTLSKASEPQMEPA
jgi:biopolymer transport protein ExbB